MSTQYNPRSGFKKEGEKGLQDSARTSDSVPQGFPGILGGMRTSFMCSGENTRNNHHTYIPKEQCFLVILNFWPDQEGQPWNEDQQNHTRNIPKILRYGPDKIPIPHHYKSPPSLKNFMQLWILWSHIAVHENNFNCIHGRKRSQGRSFKLPTARCHLLIEEQSTAQWLPPRSLVQTCHSVDFIELIITYLGIHHAWQYSLWGRRKSWEELGVGGNANLTPNSPVVVRLPRADTLTGHAHAASHA